MIDDPPAVARERRTESAVGPWERHGLETIERTNVQTPRHNWVDVSGADPVETPSQLGAWTDRGVRIIGPAWGRTRYSGGTRAPGGLTALGVQLLKAMHRKKVILDISHMADEAVADAFELWRGPIMSSHSNARALVPGDRQITDATAAEIARQGGVLGISFYASHLRPSGFATLDDVVRHAVHLARAAGGPRAAGPCTGPRGRPSGTPASGPCRGPPGSRARRPSCSR